MVNVTNNIRKYIFPFAITCTLLLLMCGCKKNETFTVTFDSNGGTGTMQPQIFIEDEPQALRLNEFTCDNCKFGYWSPLKQHVFSIPEEPKNEYRDGETIIVSANMILYAHWENITRGQSNGHEWVDLGLPSGTKWATCNVGADTPEGFGDYFAWGETAIKETYSSSTYMFSNGNKLIKYCNNAECGHDGFTDALTTLEATDDVVIANWGAGWRMPTYDEMVELINNCTVTWTIQNGVNGSLFSGPNGNSIFMPAAGYSNGSSPYATGPFGSCWSSSLYTDFPYHALILYFTADGCCVSDRYRYWGFPVRPVLIENN